MVLELSGDRLTTPAELAHLSATVRRAAREAVPGAQVDSVQAVLGVSGAGTREELLSRRVTVLPRGCSPVQAFSGQPGCEAADGGILAMPETLIVRLFGLSPEQSARLGHGAVVLDRSLGGAITVITARVHRDADTGVVLPPTRPPPNASSRSNHRARHPRPWGMPWS